MTLELSGWEVLCREESLEFQGCMKNRLQYIYSITVFFGALITAYLMMDNDLKGRTPYRSVKAPSLTTEASVDPALGSLFEVEKGLGNMGEKPIDKSRVPSQMTSRKKPIR
jgi:hypothetical protein